MPLVRIQYNPDQISLEELKTVEPTFRDHLAGELGCEDPDGDLEADDFEIHYSANGADDFTDFAVAIDIEAMDFPSRVANKSQRADNIRWHLEALLGKHNPPKVAVWLKLVNAAWSSPTA